MSHLRHFFVTSLLVLLVTIQPARAWWNAEWTLRKKITINTGQNGVAITEPIGDSAVLVRLHDGNFQFLSAKEDGSDIRFVAADDKTPLTYHIEKYDGLLNEAFVWVKIPGLKPGAAVDFWLYYGNAGEKATATSDAKKTYDADTALVFHFSEKGTPPVDSSASGITATSAPLPVDGSIIGGGILLDGNKPVGIPANPALDFADSGNMTWSAWIKPSALASNAVLYSRAENGNSLTIGVDNGVPYVEVSSAGTNQRSTATGEPVAINIWRHLAVVASGSQITLYLDGEKYAGLTMPIPALRSESTLGTSFAGELDELEISKVARPIGYLQFAAISQSGSEKAGKLLATAPEEINEHGENEITKHLSLIGDISKSLTFDGWVVIGLCFILALVGWVVTFQKMTYLGKIKKATKVFLKQWDNVSSDITVLDHGNKENISSLAGHANAKTRRLMRHSPLYAIYHAGSDEIYDRVKKEDFKGLTGRSMHAIKTSMEGGLAREVHKLNSNLVFLTIGIAGGPYLGLLGTVIGVMITFAVIAKSGQVEVNSIAPGIAGALLATVAGLAVAIPALFAYSYVSSQIKDAVAEMQLFIEEFLAKVAEFYPEK